MSLTAQIVAELVAAGLSGEALVAACERVEAAAPTPDPRAERAKYLAARRSEKWRSRLGVTQQQWSVLRDQVFERDDCCCQYCGGYAAITVDHVIPLAAGGPTVIDNLVAACRECNSSKRDRPVSEWEAHTWER